MVPYLCRMCQCTYDVPCMVAHWYTYGTPRCRTSQYCRTFIPLSVSLWNDLADLYSTVWGWRVSRAEPTVLFYCPKQLYPSLSSTIFPFLFFLSIGWYCVAGFFGLIGCRSLSSTLAQPTYFNNNNHAFIS